MPTVSETARVITSQPSDDAPELVKNAWLIWTSVINECLRRGMPRDGDGYYLYEGTLRGHVIRLWPMLTEEQRDSFERSVYGFMKEIKAARCLHKHSPTVWRIKPVWDANMSHSVPVRFAFGHVPSRAEAKLTPHEAGEDLPPGAVTIRHEEPVFTMPQTQDMPEALVSASAKRTAEMDARRELIVEWLGTQREPVAAEEVAHAFDANLHTTRSDLIALHEQGLIFSRQETSEERSVRYGGTAFARRALLYFGKQSIPVRTSQCVVDGYAHRPSERSVQQSSKEINRRLWGKLKRKGPRSRFTAAELAEASGVQPEATRSRMRDMTKEHLIGKVSFQNGAQVFKVLNSDGIREFLAQPETEVLDTVVVTAPPVPAPPANGLSVEDLMARAIQVVAENDVLRRKVLELEAKVKELQKPALDPAAVEALTRWSPLSS